MTSRAAAPLAGAGGAGEADQLVEPLRTAALVGVGPGRGGGGGGGRRGTVGMSVGGGGGGLVGHGHGPAEVGVDAQHLGLGPVGGVVEVGVAAVGVDLGHLGGVAGEGGGGVLGVAVGGGVLGRDHRGGQGDGGGGGERRGQAGPARTAGGGQHEAGRHECGSHAQHLGGQVDGAHLLHDALVVARGQAGGAAPHPHTRDGEVAEHRGDPGTASGPPGEGGARDPQLEPAGHREGQGVEQAVADVARHHGEVDDRRAGGEAGDDPPEGGRAGDVVAGGGGVLGHGDPCLSECWLPLVRSVTGWPRRASQ
jgi:hypothetical protein